jgi:outer membrane protein TolC
MSTRHLSFVRAMRAFVFVGAAIAVLAGCASVRPPTMRDAAAVRVGLVAETSADAIAPTQIPTQRDIAAPWPHDPVLSQLLAQARRASPDLRAAQARLDAARAEAGLAAREAMPQGTLSAQATETRLSLVEADPYGLGAPRPPRRSLLWAGFAIRWELDLFGRVGTAQAIAERGVDAEAAALAGATVMLEAEVVRLYAAYRERESALASLDDAIRISEQRRRDLSARVAAGLAESTELWQAEAARDGWQAERAAADAARLALRNRLLSAIGVSPLLDHPMRRLLEAPAGIPAPPAFDAYRLPADFLARRPDVLAAEARLRAAIGETVLADRADWPSLSLLGTLVSLSSAGGFGDAASIGSMFGPSLEWDWMGFGRHELREAAARARQDAAASEFEAEVLRAVADADSAIRTWAASRAAWDEAVSASTMADRVWRRARSRAEAGLEPRASAATAHLVALEAARRASGAQAEAVAAYAALHLALGVDPPTATASPRTAAHRD